MIDVQREYVTPGRPFFLNGVEASLKACARLLAHARSASWEVAHVRHEQPKEPFMIGSEYSDFAPGFEPTDNEQVFVKDKLSCFSNADFARLTARASEHKRRLVLAGYGGTMCCLSTAVEAMHRGVRPVWVQDASLSRASRIADEATVHKHLTEVMRIYADVLSTFELVVQPTADEVHRERR